MTGVTRQFPTRLLDAWREAQPAIPLAAMWLSGAFLSMVLVIYLFQKTHWLFLYIVMWLPMFAFAAGAVVILLGIYGFFRALLVEPLPPERPIETALSQTGFGDAGLASEDQMHAALGGRVADPQPLPEFPD